MTFLWPLVTIIALQHLKLNPLNLGHLSAFQMLLNPKPDYKLNIYKKEQAANP